MRISRRWNGRILTLGIRGALTTYEQSRTLRTTIDGQVALGHRKLVLDLARLRRIDSRGLGTLIQCLRAVRQAGGELKLAALTRRLNDLIVISGLLRVFDVHDTVPQAVLAFDAVAAAPLPAAA